MHRQTLFEFFIRFEACRKHDKRFHDRSALGVRFTYYGGHQHGGMLNQAALHLSRADAVARALDDVVATSFVP